MREKIEVVHRNTYWVIRITFFIVAVCFITCPDFTGLKPGEEDPQPPPDPPVLIAPEDSTLFFPFEYIDFIWHAIEGAEYYEIRFKPLKWGTIFFWQVQSSSAVHRSLAENFYMWSVRGYSSNWTDYTNWSEERFLHVAHP